MSLPAMFMVLLNGILMLGFDIIMPVMPVALPGALNTLPVISIADRRLFFTLMPVTNPRKKFLSMRMLRLLPPKEPMAHCPV